MRRIVALMALIAVLPGALLAQQRDVSNSAKIDALLARLVRRDAPGAAVLVISNGRVLHGKGYGLANVEARTPITTKTTFDLASVSKQFTAMAVMMMVERGKLSYSDTLSRFFPSFPPWARRITVRHLLTHTSGIPDYMDAFQEHPPAVGKEPTSRDAVTMLSRIPDPCFLPGEKYEYSNSGYVVLAQIVEKVSGVPFPQFMKKNVFDPLGMTSAIVSDQVRAPSRNRAVSYDASWLFGWRYRDADYTPFNRIYGDGNVNASLEDMYKWDQALYGESLVKQATLVKAFEPMQLNDGTRTNYGFGWRVVTWHNRRALQHGGAWAGFRSNIVRFPAERLTVIVLSNLKLFKVSETAETISGYYLDSKK